MTARVSRTYTFLSGLYHAEEFICNNYTCEVFLDVNEIDNENHQVAMERINALFQMFIEDSVFVNISETSAIEAYLKAGIRVCTLPDDPFDQVVAGVLFKKINAICEGIMTVTEIKLSSYTGEDVVYYIGKDEILEFLGGEKSWYNNPNTSISDWAKKSRKEKVVELKKDCLSWESFDLGFAKSKTEDAKKEVLFKNREK